jgi:hypothetical protein
MYTIKKRCSMPKCPNCGQETARTIDWACQWCGYPLLSPAYKKIPKTYKQLKSEFKPKPELEPEPMPEPVPVLEPEPIPEPEPVLEPEPKLEPEPIPESEAEVTEKGITVEGLYSAYGDKITADTKLVDKILKVTGVVDKIVVNDIHEIYYIILTGTVKKEDQHVRCTFDKKDKHELDRLTEGQTVTVEGKYDGYRINIILVDCALIS